MRLGEIADAFGLASYARAGSTIRQLKGRLVMDKALARRINDIVLLD
jgi:putative transposase